MNSEWSYDFVALANVSGTLPQPPNKKNKNYFALIIQAELLEPAVKGTLNVLNSCAKFPSVDLIVMTSSMAAVLNDKKA